MRGNGPAEAEAARRTRRRASPVPPVTAAGSSPSPAAVRLFGRRYAEVVQQPVQPRPGGGEGVALRGDAERIGGAALVELRPTPGVPGAGRTGLPLARPRRVHAQRWGDAAPPALGPGRRGPHRCALRAGRAHHRAAPPRHRATAGEPPGAGRHRKHGAGGGARPGHAPRRGSPGRPRARVAVASEGASSPRGLRGPSSPPRPHPPPGRCASRSSDSGRRARPPGTG